MQRGTRCLLGKKGGPIFVTNEGGGKKGTERFTWKKKAEGGKKKLSSGMSGVKNDGKT